MSATKENFAQMLEDQPLKTLNTGDVVTGTVEYVSDTELQLDLGAKVTGIIKAEQIINSHSIARSDMVNNKTFFNRIYIHYLLSFSSE